MVDLRHFDSACARARGKTKKFDDCPKLSEFALPYFIDETKRIGHRSLGERPTGATAGRSAMKPIDDDDTEDSNRPLDLRTPWRGFRRPVPPLHDRGVRNAILTADPPAVQIEPGLRPQSPESGNIRGMSQRLSSKPTLIPGDREREKGRRIAKARHWRGFLLLCGQCQ